MPLHRLDVISWWGNLYTGGPINGRRCGAGATSPGDDTAQLVRATWREARKTVWRNNELLQFDFQQFLFACQARILLRLNKPAEVPIYSAI